jgi:integrase
MTLVPPPRREGKMAERMYQLKNGDWFLDCQYKKIRIRESAQTSDRRIAERILAQRMVEVEGGVYKRNGKKFKNLAEEWIKEELPKKARNRGNGQKSRDQYQKIIESHIIPFFGDKTLEQIIPLDGKGQSEVSRYLESKADEPKTTFTIHRFLVDWIFSYGFNGFVLPKVTSRNPGKKQTKFLDQGQMESIVSIMSPKYKPMGWIMAFTGIDISECLDLKWSNIKDGILTLPRNKTGVARRISLPAKALSVLEAVKRETKSESSNVVDISEGLSRQEKKIFPEVKFWGFTSSFKRAKNKAGFPWARPKDLRHFFGSHLINSGVDSLKVARMMGHTNVNMIHKTYGHLSDDTIKDAARHFQ